MKRLLLLFLLLSVVSAPSTCTGCGDVNCAYQGCNQIECSGQVYYCGTQPAGTQQFFPVPPCGTITCPGTNGFRYSCVYDSASSSYKFVPDTALCGQSCAPDTSSCKGLKGSTYCNLCCPPGLMDCDGIAANGCESPATQNCINDADLDRSLCESSGKSWISEVTWNYGCPMPPCYGACCGDDSDESWAPYDYSSTGRCCIRGKPVENLQIFEGYLCSHGMISACKYDSSGIGASRIQVLGECATVDYDKFHCSPSGSWATGAGGTYGCNGKACAKCSYGTCDESGCAGGTCVSPMTTCAGACVNVLTDQKNCGTCGNSCTAGMTCYSGACIAPPTSACGNGICETAETCPTDKCCYGAWADTNYDLNNCGSCGNRCPQNEQCSAGSCICSAGYVDCDSTPGCETMGTYCPTKNCVADSECPSGNVCCSGKCLTPFCTDERDCDDGNPCTADSCSQCSQCSHVPKTCSSTFDGCCPSPSCTSDPDCAECADDNDCLSCESCRSGICVPSICGSSCGQGMVCNSANSKCVPLPPNCYSADSCTYLNCSSSGVSCWKDPQCTVQKTSNQTRKAYCIDDPDCNDGSECTYDFCEPLSPESDEFGCRHFTAECGSSCSNGVCSSDGFCVKPGKKGGSCDCESCGEGLSCTSGKCAELKDCGDGKCDESECSRCPKDCELDECVLNDVCDWPIGENCVNSPLACACPLGRNCDNKGQYEDVRDALWCYSALKACGDGICTAKECHTCALDCDGPKDICIGDGYCDSAIGESCENSVDCSCFFDIVLPKQEIDLDSGVKQTVSFKIKNTGTSKQTYNVRLSGSVDVSWSDATVELGPGEESLQQVEVYSGETGLHFLEIGVDQGGNITRTAIPFSIAEPTVLEKVKRAIVDPIMEVKSYLEFIVLVGSAVYGVFHFFIRKKPPEYEPYSAAPEASYGYETAKRP